MIHKFCIETQSDWDEGIQYLLFAVRESKNESLGFSPFELMFCREVRGPLTALKDSWLSHEYSEPSVTVSQYFEKLKSILLKVHNIAMENLKVSQTKMKIKYDRKTKEILSLVTALWSSFPFLVIPLQQNTLVLISLNLKLTI